MLTLLAERRAGVTCHIYGKNAAKRDVQLAYSRYQQQCPNDTLQLIQWSDASLSAKLLRLFRFA